MALEDDIRRLARVPMLGELEAEALRLLAFSAEAKILRTGDVVFRAGDASDAGYFIMSGSVALDGGGTEPARIAGPDSLLGELALLIESKRPVTATARSATTVLKISRPLFHRILEEYPSSAARMHKQAATRLSEFMQDLRQLPGFAETPGG